MFLPDDSTVLLFGPKILLYLLSVKTKRDGATGITLYRRFGTIPLTSSHTPLFFGLYTVLIDSMFDIAFVQSKAKLKGLRNLIPANPHCRAGKRVILADQYTIATSGCSRPDIHDISLLTVHLR